MTPLFLGVALSIAAPAAKEKPKELPKLEGSWLLSQKGGLGGDLTWTFKKDGKVTFSDGRTQDEEGTYEVDLTKSPATMDLRMPAAIARKRKADVGIFKIEGDILTLCLHRDARPMDFISPRGSGIMLFSLKRVKKD
jgi:uncharacterized protein (TIGR03067 family)